MHRQQRLQHLGREIAQLAFDRHRPELVALPFLDHISDDEVLPVVGQFGDGGNDAEIGIALRQVELAQLLLVIGQPVRIIGGVGREKGRQAAFTRRHLPLQPAVRESMVAKDVDLPDAAAIPLGDLIDDIDAVLVEPHQLRFDGCGIAALPLVELDDASDVRAHAAARIDLARRQMQFGVDLVGLEATVPLKDDAVDHRVLGDLNGQRTIIVGDLEIREQLGLRKRAQRRIERRARIALPDAQLRIGAHRIRLEPLVAGDRDRTDRAAHIGRRVGDRARHTRRRRPDSGRSRCGGRSGRRRCGRRRAGLRQRGHRKASEHRPGHQGREDGSCSGSESLHWAMVLVTN